MAVVSRPLLTPTMPSVGRTGRFTVTQKLCVALIMGEPLSETMTRSEVTSGDWESSGRHVRTPVLGLMVALVGALARPKVSTSGGDSGSLAVLVTMSVEPAMTTRLGLVDSTGG